jgi:hypothetical protein
MAKPELMNAIEALEISLEFTFVPFSQSRNKAEKNRSLNWRVTLKVRGRAIFTTDYGAGIAHCPSYRQTLTGRMSNDEAEAIKYETETGFARRPSAEYFPKGKAINPDPCDVLYCLASDADVLNYSNFEEWAESLGYDTDSRKAEKTYRACLETALALRNGLGDEGLRVLQEACQDY